MLIDQPHALDDETKRKERLGKLPKMIQLGKDTTERPAWAYWLLPLIKFYWHTATPMCWHIIYSYFYSTTKGRVEHVLQTQNGLQRLSYLARGSFQTMCADLPLSHHAVDQLPACACHCLGMWLRKKKSPKPSVSWVVSGQIMLPTLKVILNIKRTEEFSRAPGA